MTYTIITRSVPPCAYCDMAKALLDSKGIAYTEYDLSANEGSIGLFKALGYKTIPIITDGEWVIGGYDDLVNHLKPRNTAVVSDAMPENLRLVRVIIGTDDSYKMLPSTPTIEMIADIGFNGDVDLALGHAAISKEIEDCYKRMVAKAPSVSLFSHD